MSISYVGGKGDGTAGVGGGAVAIDSGLAGGSGGDFGFPFPISGSAVDHARKVSKDLFLNDTWPLAKYPLKWLIDKFAPVPDWESVTT